MSEKKDLTVEAQNYSLKHKLKQYTSGKGIQRAISEMGSSKYKDRMETLRSADDEMRTTAVLFKDYLKNAERAFKDNRYLDVAHWCAMINDGVKLMLKDAKPVIDLQDSEIAEYYTRHEDASPELNYFSADDGLVSTAGLMNKLFGNSIEKIYWKKIRESKLAVQSLVSKTEKLVAITYSSLDRMGTARAQGNIGSWIEDLQRISKAQGEFQVFAKGVYDKHLKQLADIVKANKEQSSVQSPVSSVPSQTAPKEIPSEDKAGEAEELVDNEPLDLINKKEPAQAPEEKFDKGRPALNDPRNVKKDNDKELEQWSKVQEFLKGNKPADSKIEEKSVAAPGVNEPIVSEKIEDVKVESPKIDIPKPVIPEAPKVIEQPKMEAIKPVEAPKAVVAPPVELPKAVVAPQVSVPQVPKAPNQVTVETPPKRGRGRPRKHPLPTANTQVSATPPSVQETVQPAQEVPDNPFSSAPSVVPSVSAPKLPKEAPVHVDIKGKDPETTPSPDERVDSGDKKATLVMIPKIKPDNLDEIKDKLEKQLGHPIRFVTKENGAGIAAGLKDAGWDLDAIIFDDAVKQISAPKADPVALLDDPKFLANLPRLSNGFFDKGRIIDVVKSPKDNATTNLYPEFKNMDKVTRKAVIDKLNELDEQNLKNPQSEAPKTESPKIETVKNEPKVDLPKSTPVQAPKAPELTEDEVDQEIYVHGDVVEKILGKSMAEVTPKDTFQLLNSREYLDSLPKMPGDSRSFNLALIAKFPEVKLLKTEDSDSTKFYFDVLKQIQSGKIPYPKSKAAYDVNNLMVKLAHKKFYIELEKVAKTQNVGLMAALMCKYSEEIENVDPDMSIKLLIQAGKLLD